MIDNAPLETLLTDENDWSTVVEIYSQDATPAADGFDPGDALDCYAAIGGDSPITFMGVEYKRLVKSFGGVKRTITAESNQATVDFSNVSREISQFEFANGFEGLIMVIRSISRNSSTTLDDSLILFTGRCEKPKSGNKDSLSISANWILGGLEVLIPRRKFTKEDQEGRTATDPEFEGFLFIPQQGVGSYSVRVKRGGILGLFGFKKWVTRTLAWSSYSDLDASKCLPEVLGRSQLMGTHIAYADTGGFILMRTAMCEGEILDFTNARSLDPNLPLSGVDYLEILGLTGAANLDSGGTSPGNYSRTACIRGKASNSLVDVNESAPEIVAIIEGRLMTIPDGAGDWVTLDTWTDNPAAHGRWLVTSDDYFKLHENWINDTDATECYLYNDELIIDRSLSDFIYVVQG